MIYRIALMLILLLQPFLVAASSSKWSVFLSNPTQDTYRPLVAQIEKCKKKSCKEDVKPDSQAVRKLVKLVAMNNPYAVDVAFSSLSLLDGGDLEDIIRSLGLLTESNPELFLTCINRYHLSDYKLDDLLTMLPLATVDDKKARIETVQKRINSLSEVTNPQLFKVRDRALNFLRQFLEELSILPEM